MSDGVVVRTACGSDARALLDLAKAVAGEAEGWLGPAGGWRSAADERRYLRSLRNHPDAAVFVAEAAGGIVGRVSVRRDPNPGSAHVASLGMFVAKSHRRQGIGTALVGAAVDWARRAGIRKLELHVFPDNAPAIALYERLGFAREGYRRRHVRRGTGYSDAVLMALDLAEQDGARG